MAGKIVEKEMDKISNLPDFILHEILSFLPRKDAARTSVLSKRWSSIWDSFPIFDFHQSRYIKGSGIVTPEYDEKVRGLVNFVDNSLQKFVQKKLRMEIFRLFLRFVDHNLVSTIDRSVLLALTNGVQELSLNVTTDLTEYTQELYTLPESWFAVKPVNGVSTFDRLQILSLQHVCLSEDVIEEIIRTCPNISYFALKHFAGLKTVKISKLDKLESLIIVDAQPKELIDGVSIDAPKLKHFTFDPFCHTIMPSNISLTSCHDLKELSLQLCGITDDWLHWYLSKFPSLEKLEIFHTPNLRRVRISGQQLKTLRLDRCDNIESIQIDAPSLSLFNLKTLKMPLLVPESYSCPVDIEYQLVEDYGRVDSSWFLELRKFLGDSPQRNFFTISHFENEVCFDLEQLGQVTFPPAIKIDHLNLTAYGNTALADCDALIDGLLWSCHPMTISVPTNSTFQKNCIKVLHEKLLDKERSLCCSSSHVKCWRHDLKAAKIESFKVTGDERLIPSNLLLDKLQSPIRDQEVRFSL